MSPSKTVKEELSESDSSELPSSKIARARQDAAEALRQVKELQTSSEHRFGALQHQIGAIQTQLGSNEHTLGRMSDNIGRLLIADERRLAREQLTEQHNQEWGATVRWVIPMVFTAFGVVIGFCVWLLGRLPR